jgi:hypothetical protein
MKEKKNGPFPASAAKGCLASSNFNFIYRSRPVSTSLSLARRSFKVSFPSFFIYTNSKRSTTPLLPTLSFLSHLFHLSLPRTPLSLHWSTTTRSLLLLLTLSILHNLTSAFPNGQRPFFPNGLRPQLHPLPLSQLRSLRLCSQLHGFLPHHNSSASGPH